jgi:peptidyl-prolyl cis-trans isomerase C
MKFIGLFFSMVLLSSLTWGQTATSTQTNPTPEDRDKSVNLLLHGMVLDKEMFEYRLQTALQNGQNDSEELRTALRDELYNRALLIEQAKRTGLTKNKVVKLLIQETQENVYIDLLLQDYLKIHPITEEQLKAEYDRQIQQLGTKGTLVEYHLAALIVPEENQAQELIQKTKKENFSQLASQYSIDASASRGGDLGWLQMSQLSPSVQTVVSRLAKNQVASTPLLIGKNWHVLKLIDRREGKPASFHESIERLKPVVIQKIRQEYIEQLRHAHIQERIQPE